MIGAEFEPFQCRSSSRVDGGSINVDETRIAVNVDMVRLAR